MLAFPKRKTWRSKEHLAHVRSLSCCACGRQGPSEAHHVVTGGKGLKCSDALACALCTRRHQLWHLRARFVDTKTREAAMALQWMGVVAALGGTRLAHNVSAEDVARRLAAERESR